MKRVTLFSPLTLEGIKKGWQQHFLAARVHPASKDAGGPRPRPRPGTRASDNVHDKYKHIDSQKPMQNLCEVKFGAKAIQKWTGQSIVWVELNKSHGVHHKCTTIHLETYTQSIKKTKSGASNRLLGSPRCENGSRASTHWDHSGTICSSSWYKNEQNAIRKIHSQLNGKLYIILTLDSSRNGIKMKGTNRRFSGLS